MVSFIVGLTQECAVFLRKWHASVHVHACHTKHQHAFLLKSKNSTASASTFHLCISLTKKKNKTYGGLAPVYHAVGLRCWTRGHSLINSSRQTKTTTKTVGNREIFLRMLGGRVWEVFSSGESSTAEAGSEGHIQESAVTKVWSINALYALFCLFFNRTIDRQCSILVTWLRCDKRALGNK